MIGLIKNDLRGVFISGVFQLNLYWVITYHDGIIFEPHLSVSTVKLVMIA